MDCEFNKRTQCPSRCHTLNVPASNRGKHAVVTGLRAPPSAEVHPPPSFLF